MQSVEGISSLVPDPINMATETITRLNSQGMRYEFEPLRIVDECREALFELPKGKVGVVIGSGPNTPYWRAKGWKTLDIDPSSKADIIVDANLMEDLIPPESVDFIYAEAVRMDPMGLEGVSPARLLNQCNKALRQGGKLIIRTAHFEGVPDTTLPDRKKYIKLLQAHGFHGIAELSPIHYHNEEHTSSEQVVIYYGEKKRDGFEMLSTVKEN